MTGIALVRAVRPALRRPDAPPSHIRLLASAVACAALLAWGAVSAAAQAGAGGEAATGRLGPVLPVPYERAIEAGTRSRTGAAGP
ncbi:MAG: hypothetical protein Q8W49_12705, partial [Candidatus Palauibacterales bacterium]|nr:hypothetical protein [Candidatus Palauibacterales bacterium]